MGQPKEITLSVTPTANDAESGFVADVNEVVDYEEHGKEKPAYAKDSKHAPAVAIVIGTKKK